MLTFHHWFRQKPVNVVICKEQRKKGTYPTLMRCTSFIFLSNTYMHVATQNKPSVYSFKRQVQKYPGNSIRRFLILSNLLAGRVRQASLFSRGSLSGCQQLGRWRSPLRRRAGCSPPTPNQEIWQGRKTGHRRMHLRLPARKMVSSTWWRHQIETFSVLLAFVRGIHRWPVNSAQRPVTRSFDVFFDLRLNERLSKQSLGWRWWFEMPSRPLWRHSNAARWTMGYVE